MADDAIVEDTYRAIEQARTSGKIAKGANEVTKSIERGTAKLVAIAKDVSPKEIVMHLPILSKEKGVVCIEVTSKEELGAAAGLQVGTTAVSITKDGEAKKIISRIIDQLGKPAKPEPKVEVKEEPKEEKKEKPKEEKKEKPAKAEKSE